MQRPGHGHRLVHGPGHEQVAGGGLREYAVGHAQERGQGVDADIDDQLGPEQAVHIVADAGVQAGAIEQGGHGLDRPSPTGRSAEHGGAAAGMTHPAGGEQGGGLGGDPGRGPIGPDRDDELLEVAEAVLQGEHQPVLGQQVAGRGRSRSGGAGLGADEDQVGPAAVVFGVGEHPHR